MRHDLRDNSLDRHRFTQHSEDEIRRRAIRVKLSALLQEETFSTGIQFLSDPNPAIRIEVYNKLTNDHQLKTILPWLIKGLYDESAEVRVFCITWILYKQGSLYLYGEELSSEHFIPKDLLNRLVNDQDNDIKVYALIAYIRQYPLMGTDLLSVFLDSTPQLQIQNFFNKLSVHKLRNFTFVYLSPEVVLKLKPWVTHRDAEIASTVINSLSLFRGDEFLSFLEERYELEKRSEVRRDLKFCLWLIYQRQENND